jgi:hypothetical protein
MGRDSIYFGTVVERWFREGNGGYYEARVVVFDDVLETGLDIRVHGWVTNEKF